MLSLNLQCDSSDASTRDSDLICPLLNDFLEDPVQLPCCGKAISRLQILQSLEYLPNCPLCREDISTTDFTSIPTMRNLVGLIDTARQMGSVPAPPIAKPKGEWKAIITTLKDTYSNYRSKIGRLEISNDKVVYKTLLIPVIDRSGSMGGKPMVQVRYSLKRLVDMTYANPNLITTVVTYDDRVDTYPISTSTPRSYFDHTFGEIHARGGTSFKSAFKGIIDVATTHKDVSDVASMIVVFLTDGEDSSVAKPERFRLVQSLHEEIKKIWTKEYIIHSVGFGTNHDYDFLNLLRLIGTEEGAYRYADPNEDDDILSSKINSVLDVIAQSSFIPLKILPESNLEILGGSNGIFWIRLGMSDEDIRRQSTSPIVFNVDEEETISILAEMRESTDLWSEWYSKLIDDIASELLTLAKESKAIVSSSKSNDAALPLDLHLELLLRRANSILVRLDVYTVNYHRLISLMETINSLRKGENVNELKLNDIKFEGKFATKLNGNSSSSNSGSRVSSASSAHVSTPSITSTISKVTIWPILDLPRCRRLNSSNSSHPLFITLGRSNNRDAIQWIKNHQNEVTNVSQNMSNAIHITSSIGRIALTSSILDLNILNINQVDGEQRSPLDLSILYGYWKTFDLLYFKGAKLCLDGQLLLRTCISKGYWECASRLLKYKLAVVTDDMLDNVPTAEGLQWLSNHSTKDLPLEMAILKGAVDIVRDKINSSNNISWIGLQEVFLKSTQDYISIVKHVLDLKKALAHEIIPVVDEVTWPLFIACEKGCLPMVKLLLQYVTREEINTRNNKGTTCLWIAACNRHIDLLHELILHGADPNIPNFKGDSALICCCQKGSDNIVNLLLEAGIDLNLFNPERDNPVLICCRTGQDTILETLLLRHRQLGNLSEILEYYAQIDGFPPLLAATELNRVACIRVCKKFGANLEWTTKLDNTVIPGATALHLACHYGRLEAAKVLCELGSDINAKTKIGGYTPLHIAIRSGHSILVRYLLSRDRTALSIIDNDGRLPEYYASMQGRDDIKDEFFTDKLGVLFNRMLIDESTVAAGVLLKYGQSLGCYESIDFSITNLGQGDTLLSKSLICGNVELARMLEQIGFSSQSRDYYGLTPDFWYSYLYGATPTKEETIHQLNNVRAVASSSIQNRMLTNLSHGRPQLTGNIIPAIDFRKKMTEGYTIKTHKSVLAKIRNASEPPILGFLEKLKNNRVFPDGKECLEQILWESRVHIVKLLASTKFESNQVSQSSQSSKSSQSTEIVLGSRQLIQEILSPIHIMALYLYTGNATVCNQVNLTLSNYNEKNLWGPFVICLYQAINQLPPLPVGTEVYRGVDYTFDPSLYTIGTKITWNSFSIASTDWRSSSELIKEKRGMIFIIKSRGGKSVSRYSRNPVDSEVIFLPGTIFTINGLYRHDVIALAQANIRNTTFTAKDTDLNKASQGTASIILEIEEC